MEQSDPNLIPELTAAEKEALRANGLSESDLALAERAMRTAKKHLDPSQVRQFVARPLLQHALTTVERKKRRERNKAAKKQRQLRPKKKHGRV
jgi:hypothetical protein